MTDQALPLPARRSSVEKLIGRSGALLRGVTHRDVRARLVLFWLILAVVAPILPLSRSPKAIFLASSRLAAHGRTGRGLFLAWH